MVQVRTQAWKKLAFRALRRMESEYTSERLRRLARAWFDIDIGLYSYGCFDPDRFPPGTVIGRYCSIARSAATFDSDHPPGNAILHPVAYHPGFGAVDEWRIDPAPKVIEDDVWIGHNAVLLAGATKIGRGAIIAAGAVVTKPVERYAVVAGVPAKKVRARFSDARASEIEASGWWMFNSLELKEFFVSHPNWLSGDALKIKIAS
jgi:virginiamycin A acetyltransferase